LEHANYSVDIHTTHFSFTRHDSIRVHTAVYASAAYAATEALRFGLVRPAFCPVPSVFHSLCKHWPSERISIKFVGGNHYHQQIKRLYFWRNWNRNKGANCKIRQNIRIDV